MSERPTRYKVRPAAADAAITKKDAIIRAFESALDEASVHGDAVLRMEVCFKSGGVAYALIDRSTKEKIF